jgi:hypothetical protein
MPNTPPFANWIKGVIHGKELDLNNLNDLDTMLLCNKPSQVALRYTRLKAYGNHFRMDDPKNKFLQTYDNAIASIFEQQIVDVKKMSIQYVGVIKDIVIGLWPNANSCCDFQM